MAGAIRSYDKEETEKLMDLDPRSRDIHRLASSAKGFLSVNSSPPSKGSNSPTTKSHWETRYQFIYSEDELIELKKENESLQKQLHEETLASIPPEEITEEMRTFIPKALAFIELYRSEPVDGPN